MARLRGTEGPRPTADGSRATPSDFFATLGRAPRASRRTSGQCQSRAVVPRYYVIDCTRALNCGIGTGLGRRHWRIRAVPGSMQGRCLEHAVADCAPEVIQTESDVQNGKAAAVAPRYSAGPGAGRGAGHAVRGLGRPPADRSAGRDLRAPSDGGPAATVDRGHRPRARHRRPVLPSRPAHPRHRAESGDDGSRVRRRGGDLAAPGRPRATAAVAPPGTGHGLRPRHRGLHRPVERRGLAPGRRRDADRPVHPRAPCPTALSALGLRRSRGNTGNGRRAHLVPCFHLVRAVLPVQHDRRGGGPRACRTHPAGPAGRCCGNGRPAWKSNGISAAGWPPRPNAPGSRGRCTTSSGTTCP